MYSVIKKVPFEMAHKLTKSFAEECQTIHGHSYILEVIVKSESLDNFGMVIDLKMLGNLIQERVLKDLDHKCLIFEDDPIFPALQGIKRNLVLPTKYNPTAENMAENIHAILYPELIRMIPLLYSLTIRLHETATGYVEFTRS